MNTRVKTMSKPFSKQALEVINKRYLARNDDHEIIEDYLGMFRRVADTLGEDKKEELYQAMVNKKFTPAGRTLANAGGPTSLVSNCIVLHMTDSMDGIFQTLKDAGLLQQQGSGLGFAWHLLRPAGTKAKRNRGTIQILESPTSPSSRVPPKLRYTTKNKRDRPADIDVLGGVWARAREHA